MKPLFAHLESAERKAYQEQMRGYADLTPEFFYNQASYLAPEKSLLILVSGTYELEAIYELYDELEIPVPDKFQRRLADGGKRGLVPTDEGGTWKIWQFNPCAEIRSPSIRMIFPNSR